MEVAGVVLEKVPYQNWRVVMVNIVTTVERVGAEEWSGRGFLVRW